MPYELRNLYASQVGSFKTLREALQLLAAPAHDGLTRTGALLERRLPGLSQHVLWVNPEVPLAQAPALDQGDRMYAVAAKLSDQEDVLYHHPWLAGQTQSHASYLIGRKSYSLSHVMDQWRAQKLPQTYYFMIDNRPDDSAGDSPWKDLFDRGALACIRRRGAKYIIRHAITGEKDLQESFGVYGQSFWIRGWLSGDWLERLGYYFGFEGNEHDPRIWAAFGQEPPREALWAVETLVSVINSSSFQQVISKIEQCQSRHDEYRLYERDGKWYVVFKGEKATPLHRAAAWPYIQHLLLNRGTPVSLAQLGKITHPMGASQRHNKRDMNAQINSDVDNGGPSSRWGAADRGTTRAGGGREIARADRIVADETFSALNAFLHNRLSGKSNSDILKRFPDFQRSDSEEEDEWSERLQSWMEQIKGQISELRAEGAQKRLDPHKRGRSNAAIALKRELVQLEGDSPEFCEYLKANLKNQHGDWTYIGAESWEATPRGPAPNKQANPQHVRPADGRVRLQTL